ncbi:hypothetical protein [Pedosphaera parvula]|uniref:hypothetical protein n=1 Tax=Pedosphaera parvula TaxID=1032527 RepID=UPI00058BDC6F|nr:hypothetical protein [Pedosphaera parvula]
MSVHIDKNRASVKKSRSAAGDGWDRGDGLLEPFCEPAWGYQWLCEQGDANLLLSRDGSWQLVSSRKGVTQRHILMG